MNAKLLHEDGERTFVLVFGTGDEVVSVIERFAAEEGLRGSRFSAIGAFSEVTLGFFDWGTKDYRSIPIDEQVEVLSLLGDIALNEGTPKVHAHVVVGTADGSARGGHLLEARVRPTLEVVVEESPAHLQRATDPESGLPLLRL